MLGLGKRKAAPKGRPKPMAESEMRALLKVAAEGQEAALRAIVALKAEVAALRKAMKAKTAPSRPSAAGKRPAPRRKAAKSAAPTE